MEMQREYQMETNNTIALSVWDVGNCRSKHQELAQLIFVVTGSS